MKCQCGNNMIKTFDCKYDNTYWCKKCGSLLQWAEGSSQGRFKQLTKAIELIDKINSEADKPGNFTMGPPIENDKPEQGE